MSEVNESLQKVKEWKKRWTRKTQGLVFAIGASAVVFVVTLQHLAASQIINEELSDGITLTMEITIGALIAVVVYRYAIKGQVQTKAYLNSIFSIVLNLEVQRQKSELKNFEEHCENLKLAENCNDKIKKEYEDIEKILEKNKTNMESHVSALKDLYREWNYLVYHIPIICNQMDIITPSVIPEKLTAFEQDEDWTGLMVYVKDLLDKSSLFEIYRRVEEIKLLNLKNEHSEILTKINKELEP